MPTEEKRDFTQLPGWLDQAVSDFRQHTYQPMGHYQLLMADASTYIKRLQKALMNMAVFQRKTYDWALTCFGIHSVTDKTERADRFGEEAIELLQAMGYDRERLDRLVDYVYTRPPGDPKQEVGGVMVTLALLCTAHGITLNVEAETELERVWTKLEDIRAKRAAKPTLEEKKV